MKNFLGTFSFLLVGAALLLMAGCQGNAPAGGGDSMAGETQVSQMTEETGDSMMEIIIPEDSTDPMDSNLDKARMELDLVE